MALQENWTTFVTPHRKKNGWRVFAFNEPIKNRAIISERVSPKFCFSYSSHLYNINSDCRFNNRAENIEDNKTEAPSVYPGSFTEHRASTCQWQKAWLFLGPQAFIILKRCTCLTLLEFTDLAEETVKLWQGEAKSHVSLFRDRLLLANKGAEERCRVRCETLPRCLLSHWRMPIRMREISLKMRMHSVSVTYSQYIIYVFQTKKKKKIERLGKYLVIN